MKSLQTRRFNPGVNRLRGGCVKQLKIHQRNQIHLELNPIIFTLITWVTWSYKSNAKIPAHLQNHNSKNKI